ncbi:MAG: hypothetical protein IT185_06570 [Acidobacteria bacterium]|nr:hypothetical protein [Acidobacteriota bacterium]
MVARILLVTVLLSVSTSLHAQSYATQVWNQLQKAYTDISDSSSFGLNNYIIGKLADGATDTWTFPLERGKEYLIIGVCDNDCTDVDLVVKGGNGVIVKDEEVDDTPVTRFRVTSSGRFTVEVTMADCKDEPCFFGFGLFEK